MNCGRVNNGPTIHALRFVRGHRSKLGGLKPPSWLTLCGLGPTEPIPAYTRPECENCKRSSRWRWLKRFERRPW